MCSVYYLIGSYVSYIVRYRGLHDGAARPSTPSMGRTRDRSQRRPTRVDTVRGAGRTTMPSAPRLAPRIPVTRARTAK